MAYSFCSDDDKYLDFEAWWDPYVCCDQFFTNTAVFKAHKAMCHGHRGIGGRRRGGAGGALGAAPGPGPGPGGVAGPSEKKKGKEIAVSGAIKLAFPCQNKEKGKENAQASPETPPRLPTTESSDCEIGALEQPFGIDFSEDDFFKGDYGGGEGGSGGFCGGLSGGSGGGGNECTCTGLPTPGAGGVAGGKKGNGNAQGPLPPSPPVIESLEVPGWSSGSEFSEDEYSEDDCCDVGYGCFDGYESFDDPLNRVPDDYDESDDEYITYLLKKISSSPNPSTKSKKSTSKKGTQTSEPACNDYSCSKCKQSFGVKLEYLFHMADDHRSCGACEDNSLANLKTGAGFDYEDHYRSRRNCHYYRKFKRGDVQITEVPDSEEGNCLTCGENSDSGFALNQHYATAHTKCRSCKIQFDTQDHLCHHFRTCKVHLGKYCWPCKMIFSFKDGLNAHCTESHNSAGTNNRAGGGRLLFTCDACTKPVKSFPTEDELEAHLRFGHVRCFPCNREFGQRRSLYNHLSASSKHNFCIRCDSDFMSSKSLDVHDCLGRMAQKDLQKSHLVPVGSKQNESTRDKQLESDKPQNPIKKSIRTMG